MIICIFFNKTEIYASICIIVCLPNIKFILFGNLIFIKRTLFQELTKIDYPIKFICLGKSNGRFIADMYLRKQILNIFYRNSYGFNCIIFVFNNMK